MIVPSTARRSLPVLATLLTLSCAGAAQTRAPQHDRVIVTSDPAGTVADVSLVRDDRVTSDLVPAPRDRVWPLLPEAYRQLGLPAPALDTDRLAVAVQNHTVSRRIGDARLSALFDCGSDLTGRVADTHRVRVSIETWLESAGGSTAVRTRAEAVALSSERAGRIPCATTGRLERLIANELTSRSQR